MANLMPGEVGGMPPEYAPDQADIQRKMALAQMLRQQGMQQPQGQMIGNRYVAPSVTQRLASLLQAYQGKSMEDSAVQQQRALYGDYTQKQNNAAQRLAEALKPKVDPMQSEMPSENADGSTSYGATPMKPISPSETLSAIQQYYAMGGNNPNIASAAMEQARFGQQDQLRQDDRDFRERTLQVQQDYNKQQAEAQRAERMQELQLRLQDARTSAQDKAELQKELMKMQIEGRNETARLVAASRTAPTPVSVMGTDGKPIFVSPKDAVGRQPYSAKQEAADSLKVQQKAQSELSAQQVLDQAQMLHQHPGRLMGTGASSFMSSIPGTDARGFKANLDTFKAQTFVPMVSALKGMGALSDAEGKKLSDSVGALDPSMPENEFDESLKNITRTLYEKAKASGLNVSLPDFANFQDKKVKRYNPSTGRIE